MSNVKVSIYIESRYKVNRKRVKKAIQDILDTNSVTSEVEVSVAVIGDRKMRSLNKKYRNLDKTTNVLSFPLLEISHSGEKSSAKVSQELINGEPVALLQNDTVNRLGDIVLSYPQIILESARDEMLVDDKIDELVKHSMKHLLGIHHD